MYQSQPPGAAESVALTMLCGSDLSTSVLKGYPKRRDLRLRTIPALGLAMEPCLLALLLGLVMLLTLLEEAVRRVVLREVFWSIQAVGAIVRRAVARV